MSESVESIVNGLNKEQYQVVTEKLSNMLIIAGAGTGKTTVLVKRLAYLIMHYEIPSYNILAVTFTNKAAREMNSRVHEAIGDTKSKYLWCCTYHSACCKILRNFAMHAGIKSDFKIIDTADQTRIVKDCMEKLGLNCAKGNPQKYAHMISSMKDKGYRPHNMVLSTKESFTYERIDEVYALYQDRCLKENSLDFSEIILKCVELLKSNETVREYLQNKFKQILVDEFQDTNAIQYEWLRLLSGKNTNVLIVGDDDQSIYGWRGAVADIMNRFYNDYPHVCSHKLVLNYRSTKDILKNANELIKHANNRFFDKNLITQRDDSSKVTVYQISNPQDEAVGICCKILQLKKEYNYRYSDFAILYRTNSQSRIIEKAMVKANIPHMVIGGLKFFEREEIKNALAYINLVIDHDDNISLSRIINVPSRKIGKVTLEKIEEIAVQHGVSLFEACKLYQNVSKSKELKKFIELINELTEELDRNTLKDFEWVSLLLEKTGLIEYYRKVDEKENKAENSRCDNLDELIRAFGESKIEYDPNIDFPQTEDILNQEESNLSIRDTIADFVRTAASSDVVNISTGDSDTDSSYVSLMTIHSAKGLEFPCVIVAGFEKGLIPLGFNDFNMNAGRNDEERRLAYVAITRAKNHLFLMYCQRRSVIKFGSFYDQDTGPSEFLQDLSKGNYELKALRIR